MLLISAVLLSSGCMHYVKHSWEMALKPKMSASGISGIMLTRPDVKISSAAEEPLDALRNDFPGFARDTLSELNVESTVSNTFSFTVDRKDPKNISFSDIRFPARASADRILFTSVDLDITHSEGYVYRRVFDPVYNSYYYKETFEKKVIMNIAVVFFLYDARKDELIFEKRFSGSDEYSDSVPETEEYMMASMEKYLKNAFSDYMPRKQRMERYLIVR